MTKVAINGFGRIGRLAFRHMMADGRLDVVAINDIAPLDNLAYLLRHDSVHAEPEVSVEAGNGVLHWGDQEVKFLSVKEPAQLPWKELGVQIAVEATGLFTKREAASQHLDAGAERVVITAYGKGADLVTCMGVNEEKYDPARHHIVSNASCTTNALAVVAKVLDEEFGIVTGFLTTTHGYTASQKLVDSPSKKWRRGRAAALSIVPTTTGAALATGDVLPQLDGKVDGLALRVPVPDGSIIDFVVRTERPVSVESVNDALRRAAQSERMKGFLGYSDEELVSADIIGTNYSAIVDAQSTMAIGDRTVKVLAWYDNEWGYARRVADLTAYIAEHQG
ncbi:MAG: type I glyceraldehyde-3-phosphate dehydrogenase [Anaerolineaceae bacterium]|jgi:glyceraldehyde 3-phosphate dehydrogenase|nr:type I glyceraldehyde-3-phosphate dehydrogenase [Anaerolineae bacterium]MDX9830253.1 type I glyceraldehyde-3-phosphate dehydrogenase [Anaerolineae bacterium]NLF11484.1 type I glyceraldehyde-3-phosphate dehydrogenase [Anaerolineaceae bacterium]